jgi:transposase InsO family protein
MVLTYVSTARGFVYLAAVMDWFSRHVLAWRLSIPMDARFCVEAVEEALAIMASWRSSTARHRFERGTSPRQPVH